MHPDYNFKVVLLGAAAVGKTSLVQRFIHDKFSQNYLLTIGMEPSEKYIELDNGTIVALSIWDIAGQARFKFIRHNFFKGAKASLLVFDLTRESTLQDLKEWNKELIEICGPNVVTIVVGNKKDLTDKISVSDEECKEVVESIGSNKFIKTSALTGEHVNEAFRDLAHNLVKQATTK